MKSFTELDTWKIGLELVSEIYSITKTFPRDEIYGLTSQLKRSSTSILANLAEGFSRHTDADKSHKYTISRGECSEVKALLLISLHLEFTNADRIKRAIELSEEAGRLLSGLRRTFTR